MIGDFDGDFQIAIIPSEEDLREIKRKLQEADLLPLLNNFVWMPAVPMYGIEKTFVIEEVQGVKIAKMVSAGND